MARLLIVEDDVSLRENLVRMLQLKGHECVCCESFENAAAEALTASPDCVLLDLSLPARMDTRSVALFVRKATFPSLCLLLPIASSMRL